MVLVENCPVSLEKTLRKHTYSNTLKIYHQKMAIFQIKNSDIFHISAQNIDCGYSLEPPRRGGSNEYPQSMFLSRNNKNNVYPCKPQFYYIKVGFKGSKLYRYVFVMSSLNFKSSVVFCHNDRSSQLTILGGTCRPLALLCWILE